MAKIFNVTGVCRPEVHYMVNLTSRLEAIRKMVDAGDYFAINRGRQYGKTTTLNALTELLKKQYVVVSMDFQTMDELSFESTENFVAAFANEMLDAVEVFPDGIEEQLLAFVEGTARINSLQALFLVIKAWCGKLEKPPVLLIDEVDSATNNQVYLDFLAQLRAYYLKRPKVPTFQSVILAGVYDIRSIKRKIRPDEDHKEKSPWSVPILAENRGRRPALRRRRIIMAGSPCDIAARFRVDMDFSKEDIAGMLAEYEADYHTGMDTDKIAAAIYEYTHGYPYLVSDLCKIMDEELPGSQGFPHKSDVWTCDGVGEAVKRIVREDNALYESMLGKLKTYPELKNLMQELLFNGNPFPYVMSVSYIKDAAMFGFIRNENEIAVIANRIFETVLYNHFLAEEFAENKLYAVGASERNQFIVGGHLDIRRILEKFIEAFGELYGEEDEEFLEKIGRKYFLLFLKPIINGVGNYSIEPQTRNSERMDLVIYYRGEQNILALKLWRGKSYNERGEKQLSGYLDYFQMKKGYMLSFDFNKKKTRGVKEIVLGDKLLIEAVV
ncbi:MAG: AAA-like domain-containing protein [Lachnospiraceae bacterium]|nr:AAA-like domain-containing protein [Lachnospiraceae bacterium]